MQAMAVRCLTTLIFLFALVSVDLVRADDQSGPPDQDRVAREMISILEAYAVYKMGQFEEAYGRYLVLAEDGNRQAMLNIGHLYANGEGVEQDAEKAMAWYRRAAEAGETGAMLALARVLENGRGVTTDEAAAMRWYRKAAEGGNASAQWSLGKRLMAAGDPSSGAHWIAKARLAGHPAAQRYASGDALSDAVTREQVRALLRSMDGAALAQDAAVLTAAISHGADIRLRLSPGHDWQSMDVDALQAFWESTFARAAEYHYERRALRLKDQGQAIVARSELHEAFVRNGKRSALVIHERAVFTATPDGPRITRLSLDIRPTESSK